MKNITLGLKSLLACAKCGSGRIIALWAATLILPLVLVFVLNGLVLQPLRFKKAELDSQRRAVQVLPELVKTAEAAREERERIEAFLEPQTVESEKDLVVLLQRYAGDYKLQVLKASTHTETGDGEKGKKASAKAKAGVSGELSLQGPFHALAQWLGALETIPGITVDEWRMGMESKTQGQPVLSVKVSAGGDYVLH